MGGLPQPFRVKGRLPCRAGAAIASLVLGLACAGAGEGIGGSTGPATRTVQGTCLITFLPFNAAAGTITPSAPVPDPISDNAIGAILMDGTTVVPGLYNPATGAYSIPAVPAGTYWLHADRDYVLTSRSAVDLGWQSGGRNAAADSSPATATFDVTGLDPWQTGDYLLGYDFNSGLHTAWSGFTTGITSIHSGFSWLNLPLLDTGLGDAPRFIQMVDAINGTEHTITPEWEYQRSPLTMADGQGTTLNGAFSAIPQPDSVYLNFLRSSFASYRGQYNPHATLPSGPFIEFDSTPGAAAYGSTGEWLDGVSWQDSNPAMTADLNLGAIPSPALAPGFERICYAGESHDLSLGLPVTTIPLYFRVYGLRTYALTAPDAAHPISPLVSPVKNPTINGYSLFTDQTGRGLTPTIAWTAPDLGTPQGYEVSVYLLVANGAATSLTRLSRLYLDGARTSLTLPAGILASGQTYVFLISAYADSSYDPTAAPRAAHRFPYGLSQTLSGMIKP